MRPTRILFLLATVLVLCLVLNSVVQAQPPTGARRGSMLGGPSFLGLLRMEQVTDELDLNEDQAAKIAELVEVLTTEMRAEFEALRENEDREAVREQVGELMEGIDEKMGRELHGVLEREQMMRLYQIRSWVQPLSVTLENEYVVRRLEITDAQQEALTAASEESVAKRTELMGAIREAAPEDRRAAYEKIVALRAEADETLLDVLTDDQKEAFAEMRGEKFEMQRPERPAPSARRTPSA
jgi:Spy/CpxP family protein refolding chaperone